MAQNLPKIGTLVVATLKRTQGPLTSEFTVAEYSTAKKAVRLCRSGASVFDPHGDWYEVRDVRFVDTVRKPKDA